MAPQSAAKRATALHGGVDFGFASPAATADGRIEISIRGQWVPVPALPMHGHTVIKTGRWVKTASVHDETWMEHPFVDAEACIATLRDLPAGERPDLFTFTQKVPHAAPRYDYPMEWDSIAVASFRSFDEWWNELPRETRKNVRRAQKRGVVIGISEFNDELVHGIEAIQNECVYRQGHRYQHFGKTFDQVRRDHRSFAQRCDFITAHFEGEFIGMLKLVYCGKIASILQLNSMVAHYDKRPANALLARAVELCAERGISNLVYGKYNYGNKQESGLREFKSRHAFHNLHMPRYYVPLTHLGKFCVATRLHRDLHHILPPWFIKTATGLRAHWYARTGAAF
jgi:hypothetical protein